MILLRGAHVFDGKDWLSEGTEVLVSEKGIEAVGRSLSREGVDRTIDLSGKILCPGLIDLHCHLRDPGQEWRENIESGSLAGASGGYSTLVAMPNTDPPIDDASLVRYVIDKGQKAYGARVLPAGCVSKKRKGEELGELRKMAETGAVFFTDDGSPVKTAALLRLALLYSKDMDVRIMEHPEEPSLSAGGQVNEGFASSLSGLQGIPASSEYLSVVRGIALCRETGGKIHFTHISTASAMEAIRHAKKEGLYVTCDVTPHHLTLNEKVIHESGFNSVFKVNPPLRSQEDCDALWKGLADGTVDAIATDHAPWHMDEKDLPFQEAAFGIASLECAVAVILEAWRQRQTQVPLEKVLFALTSGPAKLLPAPTGLKGQIEVGSRGDLTVLDPFLQKEVRTIAWKSKARLTPWEGKVLTGWPVLTLRDGRIVWEALSE